MLNDVKPVSGKPPQIVASGGDYRIILHGGGLYEFCNKATEQSAPVPESSARVMIDHLVKGGITGDEAVGKYLVRHAQLCGVQKTELAISHDALDEHTRRGVANLVNRAAAQEAAEMDRVVKSDGIGFFFEWLMQGHCAFCDLDNDVIAMTTRDFISAMEERFGPMWHSYQASRAAQQVAEPRLSAPEVDCHGGPEILTGARGVPHASDKSASS